MSWSPLLAALIAFCAAVPAQSVEKKPIPLGGHQPMVEILGFKIGTNNYPMLDQKSTGYSADNSASPQADAERASRRSAQAAANRNSAIANSPVRNGGGIAPEDRSSRGRIRTRIVAIDPSDWVMVTLRNTSLLKITSIDWDFAFPRYEEGKLLLRYGVSSKVEIRPGAKKSIKHPLPRDARKCQVVNAEAVAYEMVCGRGFNDPSQLRQETVSIKKIEFVDGSVWERPGN